MSTQIAAIRQPAEDRSHAMRTALQTSLYPGASDDSILLVLAYCHAAGLDPMQKPVHIVPMWDGKARCMRDVVMPGIGLYRTNAARTGQFGGMSEPVFGPMVTEMLGNRAVTFPEWCKVTAYRQLANGRLAEFTAVEYWIENYAIKGGKDQDQAPNAMWSKRVRGQLAKCAQAQALRMAFPEAVGAGPTAEEMEGKAIIESVAAEVSPDQIEAEKIAARKTVHDEALGRHSESVEFIKERIAAEDWPAVASEWRGIPEVDQMALWLANTKGGAFSTDERKAIKERLPKAATDDHEAAQAAAEAAKARAAQGE